MVVSDAPAVDDTEKVIRCSPLSGGQVALNAVAHCASDGFSVLGGEVPLWRRLNPVCANTGVTKIAVRPERTHLMTFNETVHIEAQLATRPELLTYR